MAKYECKRYPQLGFYVGGTLTNFSNGFYETTDKAEIAVLEKLPDVVKVTEKKATADKAPE